mgnify:CR=1 FL=1
MSKVRGLCLWDTVGFALAGAVGLGGKERIRLLGHGPEDAAKVGKFIDIERLGAVEQIVKVKVANVVSRDDIGINL